MPRSARSSIALPIAGSCCWASRHDAAISRFLLEFARSEALAERLLDPRLERFIGVIYRPETELMSHCAEAVLPRHFDAFGMQKGPRQTMAGTRRV
jgi:hypothetical protein